MSPTGTRRRYLRPTIVAAAVVAAVTGAVISAVIPRRTERIQVTTLSLLASRDIGRLPARGTGAGQFCGAVGTLGAPEHCWQFGASGTITDNGDSTPFNLAAYGTPSIGIVTGIPVADTSEWADLASELAFDSVAVAGYTSAGGVLPSVPVSMTWVANIKREQSASRCVIDIGYGDGGNGIYVLYGSSAGYTIYVRGASGTNNFTLSGDDFNGSWRCYTVTVNGANTKAYIDGSEVSVSAAPTTAGDIANASAAVGVGSNSAGAYRLTGGIARARLDFVAATLADHQALCGTYAQPLVATHAAKADSTWTQTGGARCYQTGANRATCFPGGKGGAYRWDGTDYRWSVEDSRTNRILYSSAPVCATGWTCTTATIAAAVAPDGSLTAGAITMGGGSVAVGGTGYTGSATVYPRLWAKCSTGTLDASNVGGAGHWTVDCATVAGAWTEIYTGHAAVTEVQPWAATGAGAVNVTLSGADSTVWMPTVTLVSGYSVIPTAAAAVSTGDAAWAIANATGTYWATGDTVTTDIVSGAAPCWVTGSPLRLTGAVGTECTGGIKSIEVER